VAHVARDARKARFQHQDAQARAVDGLASMGEPLAAEIIAHQVAPVKVIRVSKKKRHEVAASAASHGRQAPANKGRSRIGTTVLATSWAWLAAQVDGDREKNAGYAAFAQLYRVIADP
jgi:hypothetical protein